MPITSLPCKLEILPYSAAYFADWVTNLDANLAHLKLEFVNNTGIIAHINHTSDVVLPRKIIWTYVSSKESFRYTKWPIDFNILSLGLLDGHSLHKEVKLYLNVTSTDCPMVLGSKNNSKLISEAMLNFTTHYFKADRKYSIWCYYSEIEGFENSTLYNIGRHLLFPGIAVGYKCCKQRKNLRTFRFYYHCNNFVSTYSTESTLVPFIFGAVLFAYFPILLMRFAHCMETYDGLHLSRHYKDYGEIETTTSGEEEGQHGMVNDGLQWTFLNSNGPVSFSKYMFTFCTVSDKFPVLASRLRRLLFVFLSPVVIYIKLAVYNKYFGDVIHAALDRKLPIGFLSMLGGVQESRGNFLPYLGGPFMVLSLYFLIGVFLLVIPEKLSFHLENVLPSFEDMKPSSTLLQMNMNAVEQLSLLKCSQFTGYTKVCTVIQAKLFMMFNPQTWLWLLCWQTQRWRLCVSKYFFWFPCFTRFPLVIIKCLGLVLYICICVVELIVVVCVQCLPVIHFLLLSLKAYYAAVSGGARNQRRPLRTVLGIFVTLCMSCFIFAFSLIFINSSTFVANVCIYVYLSILVYPSYSFAYIFFVGTTAYYITEIVTSFRERYLRLLRQIIEISLKLQQELREDNKAYIENETLNINMNLHSVNRVNLNGFEISLKGSEIPFLTTNDNHEYVKYLHNCPGIPSQLFEEIVRYMKPIYITMCYSLVQIVFICALAFISLYLVSKHNKSADVGGLMHVISVLVVGIIPRAVHALVSRSKRGVVKEEHTQYVTETIKTFWRRHKGSAS
ncbi:uncharacterized protein [Argopecten irradians]|uniref:uncharacterized protein n=1 Tax=Argopecten irradians TaxID=31199 RepID=UPI003716E33D